MKKWSSQNFSYVGTSDDLIMDKLKDFLNENKIEDFKVVQMEEDYIEIVFKQ